ncbi:MAG TPA: c-type cytochrome, partial [Polyangiales bacterium]
MSEQKTGSAPPRGRAKKLWKIGGLFVLGALTLCLTTLWIRAELRLGERYDPPLPSIALDARARARGEHLTQTYGCRHCHGVDLGGSVVEDSAVMYITAPNLTPGSRTVASYTPDDWARALLYGVAPDRRPLLLMPSHHLRVLSDADLAALVSYLSVAPPVTRELPQAELRLLGKLLVGAGADLLPAEQIDQTRARAPVHAAPVAATREHGQYLTRACAGCHGQDLRGGPPVGPPGSPAPPPISPDVMRGWTKQQFVRALREGKRRDGSPLDEMMPWKALRHLSDD